MVEVGIEGAITAGRGVWSVLRGGVPLVVVGFADADVVGRKEALRLGFVQSRVRLAEL